MQVIEKQLRSPCRMIATLNAAMMAVESNEFPSGTTEVTLTFRTGTGGADIQMFAQRVCRVIYGPAFKAKLNLGTNEVECYSLTSERPKSYLRLSGRIVTCETTLPISLSYDSIEL